MTPTTTEQARQQLIAKIRHANRPAAEQKAIAGLGLPLADKVKALTKERDEYKQRTQRLMTTLLETKKERDALAADAARYQWVKKQTRAFSLDMGGQHSWAVTGSFSRAKGPSLDEAIDAAIKAGVQ